MNTIERFLWVLTCGLLLWYAVKVDTRLKVYNEQVNVPEPSSCFSRDGNCK